MECPACQAPNIDGARFCAKCGSLLPANPDAADPLIGTIVGGRFRITGVLGEGGMGRVYTGEQPMGTSVRKVAVKTLLAQFAKDPQVVARFNRECGTVSELEHPNTIKVYDFGQTSTGELYIAMELLSGKSLETALEQGPLSPERVDRILGQVCGSLQEAHDKGIVHRDLKPANIFLTTRAGEEDYVKVLDFGIAKKDDKHSKAEQKLTQQGTVLGTPPYMSPEQFTGQELDHRSDIYSLGVMTYEMLTGRLPFEADTAWAWASAHMTAQPYPFEALPIGNQLPPKMRAAVMRALAKDRAHRQQSVREFYEELTIGAARPSALGGRMSMPEGAISGVASSQPGRTQLGEPAFTGAPYPTGQGAYPTGPGVNYGGYRSPSIPMHSPSGTGVPAQHVPTGSGQVFAPPPQPPPPEPKSRAGLLIAGLAVFGIVGTVAVLALTRKKEPIAEAVDAGAPIPTAVTVVQKDAPEDAGALPLSGLADAGAKAGTATSPNGTQASPHATQEPKPAVDPKADAECKAAVNLANGNNIGLALNHYRSCEGPGKVLARTAIDQASVRAAARGCPAAKDVNAAAQIGASSGLSLLHAKKCNRRALEQRAAEGE